MGISMACPWSSAFDIRSSLGDCGREVGRLRGGMVSCACLDRVGESVGLGRGVARSHTLVLLCLCGFGQPTARPGWWCRCLTTHPQLRVWVVKHL
jgi:hypothetical protein